MLLKCLMKSWTVSTAFLRDLMRFFLPLPILGCFWVRFHHLVVIDVFSRVSAVVCYILLKVFK